MNKNDIVEFLINLASDINNGILNQDELQSVSEFYMLYKFKSRINDDDEEDYLNQNELYKFLSLGWYIYSNMPK